MRGAPCRSDAGHPPDRPTAARRRRRPQPAVLTLLGVVGLNFTWAPDTRADSICGRYAEFGEDAECWYGGLGYGYSYVAPEKEAQGWLLDKSKDNDSGFNVFLGRHFTPHWFGELKYADLGQAGITNRNPLIAAAYPDAAITYQVPSLMAGYQWRVEERLKPFLKVGVSAIRNEAKGGPVPFEKQTSIQIALGAGLRYDIDRNPWFLRGDIDWYDRDAWYAGLSVGLLFGGSAPAAAPVAAEVAPPPETPPPPPPVVPVSPPDSDGDGVLDRDDECPDTVAGALVDYRGCEIVDEITLPGVQFETDSDVLKDGAENDIKEAARTLLDHPELVVEVAGHTDDRGDDDYNLGLSTRRALTVYDFLIRQGVPEDRLAWRGYGEAEPIADNATAEGRQENRRVVLRLLNQE